MVSGKDLAVVSMKKNQEIRGGGYFQTAEKAENNEKESYWDKIRGSLITAEEYFETVESREDWHRRHEEEALSDYSGTAVKIAVNIM